MLPTMIASAAAMPEASARCGPQVAGRVTPGGIVGGGAAVVVVAGAPAVQLAPLMNCRFGADAILPLDVLVALQIGRATLRKMRQNLGWAVGYNIIALPIAAGACEPAFGLVLRP